MSKDKEQVEVVRCLFALWNQDAKNAESVHETLEDAQDALGRREVVAPMLIGRLSIVQVPA